MKRTLLLIAALALGVLAAVSGPALSARPYRPAAVDFELAAPAPPPSAARAGGPYTSPPLRAPKRFNLVGMRWHGTGGDVHLKLRVRRSGGRWTRWQDVPAETADAPDPGSGEPGTRGESAPAWAGQADWVQYSASRPLAAARLHFVNTTGTATPGERRLTALRRTVNSTVIALAGLPGALVPGAHAAESQPAMVSRADWGAADCPPRAAPSYGQVKAAFVHHTVNLNDYSRAEAPAVVLGICRYHRNSNGWNDIGYNFLVDKYGTIYEGRAGGVDRPVIGAHAQGFNAQSTGIANIGTFSTVPQSSEALASMAKLIRWKLPLEGQPTAGTVVLTSAGGDKNRFPAGQKVTLNRISGHRDVGNTACPGDALYAQLPDLRRRVGDLEPATPPSTGGGGPGTRAATRLVVSAAPSILAYPGATHVTGRLATVDGGGVADAPVELQRQGTNGTFKAVARAVTSDDGSFELPFAPSKRAVVRVLFPGDATHGATQSKAATVLVRPALTATPPASRVKAGGLVTIPGTISPAKATVRLVLERRSGKGKHGKLGAYLV
ncbi:MAG: hypothetical protein QOJ07_2200, partial [Thermoleophilaceae bacterium]|nr:hypothetical protein [Thermoleophilaceae bacterium]